MTDLVSRQKSIHRPAKAFGDLPGSTVGVIKELASDLKTWTSSTQHAMPRSQMGAQSYDALQMMQVALLPDRAAGMEGSSVRHVHVERPEQMHPKSAPAVYVAENDAESEDVEGRETLPPSEPTGPSL